MIFEDLFNALKSKYYDLKESDELSDDNYEKLRKAYDELNVKIPEIPYILAEETFAYVCPDSEWELPEVFIIKKDDKCTYYMDSIAEGIKEYYSYSSFHDEITGLSMIDLMAIIISELNIPIVKIYDAADTELLNVRWLRSISE